MRNKNTLYNAIQNFRVLPHKFGILNSTNHPNFDNLSEQRRLSLQLVRHTDDSKSVVLAADMTYSLLSRLQKRAYLKQR